jgi:hypothetical protein
VSLISRLSGGGSVKNGGGRKKKTVTDPCLAEDIENIAEASIRGDLESSLLWCSKTTRRIADELNQSSYRTSHALVARVLEAKGYRLQSNRKTREGMNHPDHTRSSSLSIIK